MVAALGPNVWVRNPLLAQEISVPRDSFLGRLSRSLELFPDLHMQIGAIFAAGDPVAVEEVETATLTLTGRRYELPVACFFRIGADGLIAEVHNYWDSACHFSQLGIERDKLAELLGAPDAKIGR